MKKYISLIVSLLLIAASAFVVIYHQSIYDWWRLRDYEPPKAIVELADHTTMNKATRKVFYINHPEIEDQDAFNQDCHIEEFSIILGCYIKNKGIFLYDVKDKRLDGVIEVTAAHETLHAEYDRLSSKDKAWVDKRVVEVFKGLDNDRLKATIKQYEKQDPSSVPNELHSILGTEVRDLPQDLENYYKRYFTDRKQIVDYSDQYEAEFNSRQTRVAQYDKQLAAMKSEIDANQADLAIQAEELDSERQHLNALKAQGNAQAYNAAVDGFNTKVHDYNQLVDSTKELIASYNALVQTRNDLAVEVQNLVQAIDSTPEKY